MAGSGGRSGARRYLTAGVEQGLWSILNIGVQLALVRFMAPHGYGVFVFWSATAFMLSSLQNALTVCHIQVLAPGGPTARHRLRTERLMHLVNMIFLVTVAAGVMIADLVAKTYAEPAAALFVPAFLLQQYVRALNFSRGAPARATMQTALVLGIAIPLLVVNVVLKPDPSPADAMLSLAFAYGVVGAYGLVQATAPQYRLGMRSELSRYMRFARYSGWVFVGVTTTELQVRFSTFVVAAWFGPSALAVLNATQLLMRPIPLLSSVWSVVARTDLARHREAGDWSAYGANVRKALMIGLPLTAIWAGAVVLGWPLISRWLFDGGYAQYAWMAALWGVASVLGFGQAVINASLQVMRKFRALALANAAASAVIVLGILAAMKLMGVGGAVLGTAAGQVLEIGVMAMLLRTTLRRAAGIGGAGAGAVLR